MECMLDEVKPPVITHEILGDAISLYAVDDGSPDMADDVYFQLGKYFQAYHKREPYLLRECGLCNCEACLNVGELKLKAILHWGNAAFTEVKDIEKISGEDIITAHRLLKNSINSDEYILATNSFFDKFQNTDKTGFKKHVEHYEVLGSVHGMVKNFEPEEVKNIPVSKWKKYQFKMKLGLHMLRRSLGKPKLDYRNLPS